MEVTGYEEESLALYDCDEGYKLVGNVMRICLLNFTWSGKDPVCESKYNL